MWHRASGYFTARKFVRIFCGGSKKRNLVRYFLASKTGCACHFTAHPPPACISIACAKQGCRIRHTGPVQRGQFGRLRPVVDSGLQLSLQSTRSHASERKAAHDTKLSLLKFLLQKADVSIRAGQGSSQASATPRLVAQSRCHRSVVSCPVTPSYRALPQLSSGAPRRASYVDAVVRTVQVPLQPGPYWALFHVSTGQYQVVERTWATLPFGYTNSPFVWTKVIKVLAQAMRARGGLSGMSGLASNPANRQIA